jgi:hypothetical protein
LRFFPYPSLSDFVIQAGGKAGLHFISLRMIDFYFLSSRLASGEREICLFEEISPRLAPGEIEMTEMPK